MHDCPRCGQACDCDLEDTWLDAPIDCICDCEGYYASDDDYEDWAEDAYPELLLEDDSDPWPPDSSGRDMPLTGIHGMPQ